ncbi:MAG: InlB B-repeat-containing protein [Clostridia bacterium]|nr:InlB B-repeat-containing protein [Clostridia bacterium]
MMKKTKFLTIALCVLMSLALCFALAACNPAEGGNDTPSGNNDSVSSYTVTYVGVKTTTATVPAGGKAPEPTAQQKKSGYEFKGWYLGDKLYDFNTPVNSDITLEARFEKAPYTVAHGSAYSSGTNTLSSAKDTLIILNDDPYTGGSYTIDVTPGTANDCGVVFGIPETAPDTFWEDVDYYCAIMNKDGFFLMARVDTTTPTPWNEVASSEAFRSIYDPATTYTFKIGYVETETTGYCTVKVNGVLVASLETGKLAGPRVGVRAQEVGVIFGQASYDPDDKPTAIVPETAGDFTVAHGKFKEVGSSVASYDYNSIGVYNKGTLANGEVSVKLSKLENRYDDGIIFCLDNNGRANFWEETGVSYYFFFINLDMRAYLGKVTGDGTAPWKELAITEPLDYCDTYELKVQFALGNITCYVNGDVVFSYTDNAPLMGEKVGIRAGGFMASYEDFRIDETTVEITAPEGYLVKEGNFRAVGTNVQAMSPKSLAVKDGATFTEGTFSASVTCIGDTGLVFGLADDDMEAYFETEGVSYYFFYINKGGHPVLACVDDGVYQLPNLKESTLSAMYSSGKEYELKVVLDGGYAYCYVNDNLHAKVAVELAGNKVALRGYTGSSFGNVTVSDGKDIVTADMLIFGHSYMQLWSTYKTDFSEVSDVLNIGIGGTQSTDWTKLADEVANYNFTKAVYMIGINDFNPYNTTVSAQSVFTEIKNTLERIHELLPSAEIALVNVNKVPMAEKVPYYDMIDACNALMADFAANNDYVKLVDFASAVYGDDEALGDYFVSDNLHLNASGYALLTSLVKAALGISVA